MHGGACRTDRRKTSPMTNLPPPPTLRLTVDAQALAANWRMLNRLSGSARAAAAVKADCYGLGVDNCVPVLRDAGCAVLVVSEELDEIGRKRTAPAP